MKKAYYILIACIALLGATYFVIMPDVAALNKTNPKKTSFMRHAEARWIVQGKKKKVVQEWVKYSGISPYLVKAVVIAEDDKFYSHEGFDIEAMRVAMEKDLKAGRLKAGGSTISQQLVKNLYLTPEKSAIRKLKEALITWRLEIALPKRRILEIYLNVVEWGDGIYGAEAASRHYFGKAAVDLTPMEAARLAVVLPSPRRLNPAGEQSYVKARAELIYGIMQRRGIVPQEYLEAGEDEPARDAALPDAAPGNSPQKTTLPASPAEAASFAASGG
ncbi:MAG: monofunctional biosynthetic peptidoglycan transglycosylase [Deltaproteobacteria bacterium]|nr:monofunctional biosynthetic peptidoglycan transglycosylase [Deltaproteobacteria bacterium]